MKENGYLDGLNASYEIKKRMRSIINSYVILILNYRVHLTYQIPEKNKDS